MLDYNEQANLAQTIDQTVTPFAGVNLTPRETQLPVYLCPSDPYSPNAFVVRNEATDEQYAASSYVANWGPASGFNESERTNGPILDDEGNPIGAPPHELFETAWFAAVRDIDEPTDDHGHMVLFDAEFGPNQSRNANTGADRGLLDGSTHTISENIDLTVYRNICSINGGEVDTDF